MNFILQLLTRLLNWGSFQGQQKELRELQNQLLDQNLLLDYAQRHQLQELDREAAQIHQRMEQARARVQQTQLLLSEYVRDFRLISG